MKISKKRLEEIIKEECKNFFNQLKEDEEMLEQEERQYIDEPIQMSPEEESNELLKILKPWVEKYSQYLDPEEPEDRGFINGIGTMFELIRSIIRNQQKGNNLEEVINEYVPSERQREKWKQYKKEHPDYIPKYGKKWRETPADQLFKKDKEEKDGK